MSLVAFGDQIIYGDREWVEWNQDNVKTRHNFNVPIVSIVKGPVHSEMDLVICTEKQVNILFKGKKTVGTVSLLSILGCCLVRNDIFVIDSQTITWLNGFGKIIKRKRCQLLEIKGFDRYCVGRSLDQIHVYFELELVKSFDLKASCLYSGTHLFCASNGSIYKLENWEFVKVLGLDFEIYCVQEFQGRLLIGGEFCGLKILGAEQKEIPTRDWVQSIAIQGDRVWVGFHDGWEEIRF